jgi:hypothetical protein
MDPETFTGKETFIDKAKNKTALNIIYIVDNV